jgi:lysophospholipase L1-like esterase
VLRAAVLLVVPALLGACGGPHSGQLVVAALGDSITAGSPAYDPDPSQQALHGFGDDPRSQWEYWAQRGNERLTFRNCGVFGETTAAIAERLERCARGADVLVVQGGINDIARGESVETAAANLRAMVRAGKRLGVRVALADVLPWNNGFAGTAAQIVALNRKIAAIAAAEHARLLPFNATLADRAHPARMRAAWTVEGDHPSIAGYRRLGELAFRLP